MYKDQATPNEYDRQPYHGEPGPQPGQPEFGGFYTASGYPPVPEKRPNRSLLRLVAFLVIISLSLVILQMIIFRLKTVYVIGNKQISAEHIVSLTGLAKGDNIFSVNEDKVRDQLDQDHWIILNHLYKQYPNEIYLFVDEREIVASMQWLGIEYTLDIDGMVMEEYSDMNYAGNVPTVHGFKVSNAAVGSFLSVSDEQLVAYSSIVSELTIQRYAEHVVSINVSDVDSLTLFTTDGITVQLGNRDYMRAKIGAMRTDIAYLQQLGETSGVLDVTVPEDGKFRRE